MIIGVDIDGTVSDFANKFTKHMADQGKHILNKDVFKYMDDYAIYESTKTGECFSLEFYPNAKNVLFRLKEKGHSLGFITKRGEHTITPEAKEAIRTLTKEWQQLHFYYFEGVCFAKDKSVPAKTIDIMIEDDASNANAMAPFCQVILLNRAWNRDAVLDPSIIVAENWHEVEFIIDNLSKFQVEKSTI
jgi:uncharacterized HAD superfamily protein